MVDTSSEALHWLKLNRNPESEHDSQEQEVGGYNFLKSKRLTQVPDQCKTYKRGLCCHNFQVPSCKKERAGLPETFSRSRTKRQNSHIFIFNSDLCTYIYICMIFRHISLWTLGPHLSMPGKGPPCNRRVSAMTLANEKSTWGLEHVGTKLTKSAKKHLS